MNKLHTVFLFSGQGSQYRGMGKALFDHNSTFRHSLEQSDEVVMRLLNRSLIQELYFSEQTKFNELIITHPAIVAVEIALYKVLQQQGIEPDFVCGNSLGEFAAAVAGGIWTAETAVEAAVKQAMAVVDANAAGGMMAVLSHKRTEFESLYNRHDLFLVIAAG